MKKTYISPTFVTVELRCKNYMLEGSLIINGDRTVSGDNGGWVKEDNSPINDKNLWDNEW